MIVIETIRLNNETSNISIYTKYYNPQWVEFIKSKNGKWQKESQRWECSSKHETKVREKLLEVFGWTEENKMGKVFDVKAIINEMKGVTNPFYLFGRMIARRELRDSKAYLGEYVSFLDGNFTSWGGSVKYPLCGFTEDAALLIENVPEYFIDKLPVGVYIYESSEV